MPGGGELVIIAVIAIAVLFGAKKLPEMARSVGRSKGEFTKGLREGALPEDKEQTAPATAPPAAQEPQPASPPAAPAQPQAQPQVQPQPVQPQPQPPADPTPPTSQNGTQN